MKPHPDVLDPPTERTPIVVVANRLPVRRDATVEGGWSVSPGGMVAALAPALHDRHATWVGWTGGVDDHVVLRVLSDEDRPIDGVATAVGAVDDEDERQRLAAARQGTEVERLRHPGVLPRPAGRA